MTELIEFPLNGCDTFMLAMDVAMQRNGNSGNVCHLLLTFPHGTPLHDFRNMIAGHQTFRQVTRLRLRTPLLRAPRWRSLGAPTEAGSVVENTACKTRSDLENLILSHSLNIRAESPFGFILLPNLQEGSSILFYWHHALCDAHGGEMLIKNLSSTTTQSTVTLEPTPIATGPITTVWRKAHTTKRLIFDKSRTPIARIQIPDSRPKQRYSKIRFSKPETDSIDARSKELTGGMFPTALYLAATSRALSATAPVALARDRAFFVPVPHDMRRATRQRSPLTNQVSFAFFRIPQQSESSLLDTTNTIIEQLHDTIAEEHHYGILYFLRLIRRLPSRVFWRIIEHPTRGHPASFYFSDIGSSLSTLETFCGAPIVYATHYPPHLTPPGFTTVWSRYHDHLEVTICFDEESIDCEHINQFTQHLKDELLVGNG